MYTFGGTEGEEVRHVAINAFFFGVEDKSFESSELSLEENFFFGKKAFQ